MQSTTCAAAAAAPARARFFTTFAASSAATAASSSAAASDQGVASASKAVLEKMDHDAVCDHVIVLKGIITKQKQEIIQKDRIITQLTQTVEQFDHAQENSVSRNAEPSAVSSGSGSEVSVTRTASTQSHHTEHEVHVEDDDEKEYADLVKKSQRLALSSYIQRLELTATRNDYKALVQRHCFSQIRGDATRHKLERASQQLTLFATENATLRGSITALKAVAAKALNQSRHYGYACLTMGVCIVAHVARSYFFQ